MNDRCLLLQGVLLPAAPLDDSCPWVCGCGNKMPGEEVSVGGREEATSRCYLQVARLVNCFMANISKLSVKNR